MRPLYKKKNKKATNLLFFIPLFLYSQLIQYESELQGGWAVFPETAGGTAVAPDHVGAKDQQVFVGL